MRAKQLGKTLNDRRLNALVHPLRFIDNHSNIKYLAVDYLTLAAIVIPAIAFCQLRGEWGLAWAWNIPVVTLAVFLVGGVQHRLAGMAHEGSHYIMFKNRLANELASDWLCMFPLFSTTHQYRVIHLGHHDYTNDWEHDPELTNLGKTRMMDRFPMSRWQFIYHFYVRIFWPPAFLRYMFDNIYVTSLGNGLHPYGQAQASDQPRILGSVRLTSALGVGYLAAMVATLGGIAYFGTLTQLAMTAPALWAAACVTIYRMPEAWFYQSPIRPVYSSRLTSAMRLGYITILETAIAAGYLLTGTDWGVYFWLFWVLPLFTSFPYYMLLRDLYQHANADDGKLTNSRVVFAGPFSRWAIFVYGQDAHLTHHLYPAVPHYNLFPLHALLVENNREYAEHVVECHGTLSNRLGKPTLLDVMEQPTCEPGGAPTMPNWKQTADGQMRRIDPAQKNRQRTIAAATTATAQSVVTLSAAKNETPRDS